MIITVGSDRWHEVQHEHGRCGPRRWLHTDVHPSRETSGHRGQGCRGYRNPICFGSHWLFDPDPLHWPVHFGGCHSRHWLATETLPRDFRTMCKGFGSRTTLYALVFSCCPPPFQCHQQCASDSDAPTFVGYAASWISRLHLDCLCVGGYRLRESDHAWKCCKSHCRSHSWKWGRDRLCRDLLQQVLVDSNACDHLHWSFIAAADWTKLGMDSWTCSGGFDVDDGALQKLHNSFRLLCSCCIPPGFLPRLRTQPWEHRLGVAVVLRFGSTPWSLWRCLVDSQLHEDLQPRRAWCTERSAAGSSSSSATLPWLPGGCLPCQAQTGCFGECMCFAQRCNGSLCPAVLLVGDGFADPHSNFHDPGASGVELSDFGCSREFHPAGGSQQCGPSFGNCLELRGHGPPGQRGQRSFRGEDRGESMVELRAHGSLWADHCGSTHCASLQGRLPPGLWDGNHGVSWNGSDQQGSLGTMDLQVLHCECSLLPVQFFQHGSIAVAGAGGIKTASWSSNQFHQRGTSHCTLGDVGGFCGSRTTGRLWPQASGSDCLPHRHHPCFADSCHRCLVDPARWLSLVVPVALRDSGWCLCRTLGCANGADGKGRLGEHWLLQLGIGLLAGREWVCKDSQREHFTCKL